MKENADKSRHFRSMVYIEGEASMRKFTNSENKEQQALSIVQRMHWPLSILAFHSPTSLNNSLVDQR